MRKGYKSSLSRQRFTSNGSSTGFYRQPGSPRRREPRPPALLCMQETTRRAARGEGLRKCFASLVGKEDGISLKRTLQGAATDRRPDPQEGEGTSQHMGGLGPSQHLADDKTCDHVHSN